MYNINIVFVSSDKIRFLNRKYRGLNKATSVLSFNYYQEGQARQLAGQAEPLLGEIIICPTEARRQNLKIEKLVIHGLKNLLSEIPTAKIFRTGFAGNQGKSSQNQSVR
jgi:rRNA maturation RNase YbeY